jgi:hypothetical protein
VQWLRSVQRQSQSQDAEPYGLPYGPPGTSEHASDERSRALHQRRQEGGCAPIRHVTDATFYLDSDNIDMDIVVNPYELPDPEIAEQLLHCYLSTVHSTFPIVPPSFEDQVRRFIASQKQNRTFQVPDKWRALMNMIFAIGAKYLHLTSGEWHEDQRGHLVYMTRASHLLGMNSSIMFTSAPDLSLVQAVSPLGPVVSIEKVIDEMADRRVLLLLPHHRPCKPRMAYDRCFDQTCSSARSAPTQRRSWSQCNQKRNASANMVELAFYRMFSELCYRPSACHLDRGLHNTPASSPSRGAAW